MPEERFVIVGNGPAANQAAIILKGKAPDSRVTLFGREPVREYKPHLLPELISGRLTEEELHVRPLDHYAEMGIKLRLGQEVVGVDLKSREVILGHRERVAFSGLIIAAGGRPRIPEPLQVFQGVMLTLKTLADARAWIHALRRADSVLIVGGDLTSLSFTKVLLTMGKRVSFIVDEEALWPIRPRPGLVQEVSEALAKLGVEIICCRRLRRLARIGDNQVEVETDAGQSLRVGAVGAFYGLVPDVAFLAGSGLFIERGVLVDERLRTSVEGVYAAGDCAQVYHPGLRDYWVSIGYANAEKLGGIAALNLLGAGGSAQAPGGNIFELDGVTVNSSWWSEF
jgi:NADPH-dependent 2,4-dienoyl-CoA reductase/sulfur reductase-like enzyme